MFMNQEHHFQNINIVVRSIAFFILLMIWLPVIAWGHPSSDSSDIDFDLLITPSSPGFVLLGIEPTSVERPSSVTDLAISILSATSNMSLLPKSYALELAPFWLLGSKGLDYEKYAHSKDIFSTLIQTASFSIVTSQVKTNSDSLTTLVSTGCKFSILRGDISQEFGDYAVKLNSLYNALATINEEYHNRITNKDGNDTIMNTLESLFLQADSTSQKILKPIIEIKKTERLAEIKNEVENEIRSRHDNIEKIRHIISNLKVKRLGWKIDLAGGAAFQFPEGIVDNAELFRWGMWLTGGYEWQKTSVLGVFRYLNGDSASTDATVDVGARVIFDNLAQCSFSGESVYRKFLEDETTAQWRFALILDYAVAKNKLISFTFGRNFNGNQSKNLVASVNLLLGFGSTRPIR